MRVKVKNMPKLRLSDLLRRRKMTLDAFISESGIQTYVGLVNKCTRIGVQPPGESDYREVRPELVTSQTDGVIVLDPPAVVDERTGRAHKEEFPAPLLDDVLGKPLDTTPEDTKNTQKKRRRRKVKTPVSGSK